MPKQIMLKKFDQLADEIQQICRDTGHACVLTLGIAEQGSDDITIKTSSSISAHGSIIMMDKIKKTFKEYQDAQRNSTSRN